MKVARTDSALTVRTGHRSPAFLVVVVKALLSAGLLGPVAHRYLLGCLSFIMAAFELRGQCMSPLTPCLKATCFKATNILKV